MFFDYGSTGILQPPEYDLGPVPLPSDFGVALFGSAVFGASRDPMIRQTAEGSANSISIRVRSEDTKAPYSINGFYIDYMPSGRR